GQLPVVVGNEDVEFGHNVRMNLGRHVSPRPKSPCQDITGGRSVGRRRTNGRPTGRAPQRYDSARRSEPSWASSPTCRRHTTANSDKFLFLAVWNKCSKIWQPPIWVGENFASTTIHHYLRGFL